ncbi:BLOC-1-related complex subunit 7 isoform X2 [Passer montanus]|uniref:BLOC-1-related complex subunit 7 isoform X2 n=1 Tax=Passer montanus TaxID=9160 RepID=UPI0019618CF4|nr:BLOC-1-related complex subunit 7 isoform X2 [Passer montanus]
MAGGEGSGATASLGGHGEPLPARWGPGDAQGRSRPWGSVPRALWGQLEVCPGCREHSRGLCRGTGTHRSRGAPRQIRAGMGSTRHVGKRGASLIISSCQGWGDTDSAGHRWAALGSAAPGSSCEEHGDARRCHPALGRCKLCLVPEQQRFWGREERRVSLRKMAIITTHLQYHSSKLSRPWSWNFPALFRLFWGGS